MPEPTPILGATTNTQLVPITHAHLQTATPYTATGCPVARAIRDLYPDCEVRVTVLRILLLTMEATYLFQNAQSLQDWITHYDNKGKQQPTNLLLDFAGALWAHTASLQP